MHNNKHTQTKISPWQRLALMFFGILLTLIILEIGLRLGGFIVISLQEHRNLKAIKQKGTYRILCLGESTTAGQWPPFLEQILNQRNIDIRFSVIDKGIGGTHTWTIVSKLESNLDAYHPDMVITMMGINDWGSHMPYESVSDSKAINFLKSFRTYKLTRLLWLHIVTRLNESKQPRLLLQKTALQQVHAGEKAASPNKESLQFKKAIELNPQNDKAYAELGKVYREQGKFSEAEESYKKAIELNPGNDKAYAELGKVYREQGKFSEADELLNKAVELNPRNDGAYFELGLLYQDQNKLSQAEESLKKAIELNPRNYRVYLGLGKVYHDQGKSSKTEELFKKAIELNPGNDWAYAELGRFYHDQGKFSEAEALYKKAIELNPGNDKTYSELGWIYQDQGKFSEAEESYKKAIELDPQNDKAYRALEVLGIEMGNMELARKYGKETRDLRLNYYSLVATSNYHKLKTILDKKGIVYVCVQYPMRNLDPLKKIFHGNEKGIIFVDNEKIFKDAVAKYGSKNYFADMFGGDFGHCTEKGNRLLAENIANVILKEAFGKR